MTKCAIRTCRKEFVKRSMTHKVCGDPDCAQKYAEQQRIKAALKEKRKQAADIRRRKEAIKTRSEHIQETQKVVNQARRLEELAKGRGCISCGRTQQEVIATDGWKPGGAWDAGHFLSVGARPELRFEPKNIWLQCKSCNAGSGKYAKKAATVSKEYRENLIAQEGIELVEWLEGPHEHKKYTIEQLKEIQAINKAKLKALKEAKE